MGVWAAGVSEEAWLGKRGRGCAGGTPRYPLSSHWTGRKKGDPVRILPVPRILWELKIVPRARSAVRLRMV